jgi:D-aminoacyl-tRNA deacylase
LAQAILDATMRMLLQRVTSACVTVSGQEVGRIGTGLLVFLGVGRDDTEKEADYLLEKIVNLRVFEDVEGKMNLNLAQAGGGLLIVSQFTLYGDLRRGRRPSFDAAAPPDIAEKLYQYFVNSAREKGINTASGIFRAHMEVQIVNDGPVTLYHDTVDKFVK